MTTVLVVDDEPLIAMALKAALEDEGYSVATAANGKQGLERMSETPRPDVILLDVMMPIMSGPAMLAAMAANPHLDGIPVILLTSLPGEAIRDHAASVAAILRKPYTAGEVLGAIARVLGQGGHTER